MLTGKLSIRDLIKVDKYATPMKIDNINKQLLPSIYQPFQTPIISTSSSSKYFILIPALAIAGYLLIK